MDLKGFGVRNLLQLFAGSPMIAHHFPAPFAAGRKLPEDEELPS